ncbi:B-cell receptor-associated protein 31-like-domain-containing protein [Endogone sp. FLAS-F59071]|nr:B-cell receptor-associated protein 31-like-domain-containing protein [Endogone sp. FLAS-F59071]|eukprot:RUS19367.1 B-cell receptor-associated protein 31-like-domain-containing protein [Endogone sp. FLAS-F59071]
MNKDDWDGRFRRVKLSQAEAYPLSSNLDSISLMQRVGNEYNNEASHVVRDVRTDTNLSARKFYAQRNMYLTGFTLFLSLILNRTYSLIIDILRSDERLEKQMETENKLKERVAELEEELESKKNV